jgi:hypothetical protein
MVNPSGSHSLRAMSSEHFLFLKTVEARERLRALSIIGVPLQTRGGDR